MGEKKVIDAMEICALNTQHGHLRSTVALPIGSVIGVVLDEEVVAGYLQETVMRAVVHISMIKAVSNIFLKNDGLMSSIAKFVLNPLERKSIWFTKEEKLSGLMR